jgi:hypothetical protein
MGKLIAGCFGIIFTVFITIVIGAIAFSNPTVTATTTSKGSISEECSKTYGANTKAQHNCWLTLMARQMNEYETRRREELDQTYRRSQR